MRKFKVKVSTNRVGSEDWDTFEMPEDATPEDIEAEAQLIMWNYEEIPG